MSETKKNTTFADIERLKHEQQLEQESESRQHVAISAEQTGGFPFNAQFFYPEYDAVDTVHDQEENIVEKLTK